ncbi:hypothetical protein PAXRUDRAFT_153069 [Paxillus rubicundulus Ve08.2h10]|uniref:Uncharacterized protein n=1 Tax=Paxillus rubicundulus Ve08.2h10 TaxID=930991 RepID=A0A0D0DTG0_9AGAM|nr:hypothetical protein PAXRUDRAFT_153069 [Paxillus rubicundulus Ve08.2h10]
MSTPPPTTPGQHRGTPILTDPYFSESDYLKCNPDNEQGCTCCRLTQPVVCCGIHHPDTFVSYSSHIPKPPAIPTCSCLQPYTKVRQDLMLQDVLDDWCEEKTIAVYGWARLNDLGPSLVMSNATLNHIIDCVHHHKIHIIPDFKKETGCTHADQFDTEVIAFIKKITSSSSHPLCINTSKIKLEHVHHCEQCTAITSIKC